MHFDVVSFFLNSLVLLFITMTLGNLFGNIKFRKFNFGITGTLFIGLIIGYFLTKYAVTFPENSKFYEKATGILKGNIIDKSIMNLSLMIFIVGTGLLAAKDMKYAISKFGKQFICLAIFIPFIGAVTSYGFSKILENMSPFQITGTYTGALTSSAGLAAATESSELESKHMASHFAELDDKTKGKILSIINEAKERDAKLQNQTLPEKMTVENTASISEEDIEIFVTEAKAGVGVGHSIGYPFGVLFLILGVNFIPKIFRFNPEEEKKKYFEQKKMDLEQDSTLSSNKIPEVKMDFVGFSIAAFLGYLLGSIKIAMGPLGEFSLGSIGGAIIVSLILGFIGKIGTIHFRMDSIVLGKMRTYFLSVFLAGTGLNYGYRVVEAVTGNGIMIAVVSALVAIFSILFGFLLGHYIFHINWTLLSGAITGGMTSAPGLGAAIDALDCDEPAVSYGATQPLATLFMVIFSLIIHKLPI
ncbi:hypothetical protein EGX98_08155 [Fusobacterium necrophorum]|uniref:Membrane protein n=1 Tax=Fusobacterium necrophorum BL TaxID=1441732 RepID=A0AB73BZ36_9FUSO|nr:aspartate:alanine exchanger family transporter [Fusobacterium necrophorum]AYZ74001.1 hypothetical protein EGX98_08155 [Fusobacterium necrophorum]AZW10120.1 hypothetical protein EO219_11395 [Fusobacterium necrophorum subsp. necrophorum]KDE64288.1 membrane protein [Fusobacterium necrophorum BFTR-1]KDE65442.1 membrane protein [Fusobacterium necrophorum BL]KDE73071.1 membrane protein [Fusobacterium necrophorum BFTR-2]